MRNTKNIFTLIGLVALFVVVLFAAGASAQTSSFTYQGNLADAGVAANGTYDITFKLFDTLANGTQIGTDIVRDDVVVRDGGFTVDLDFGAAAFASGASRFLQLEVRAGSGAVTYTTLVPRQPLTSSPYAVKAANASTADSLSPTCVSCVTDANIDTVNAGKVTGVLSATQGGTGIGPAPPPAGAFLRSNGTGWALSGITAPDIPTNLGSYIQNIPGFGTQSASFNITGGGNANIFNATTQYNIGGNRVLSATGTNLFVGIDAGPLSTGINNSFFGGLAGQFNTSGNSNSFFGTYAGRANIGDFNSFFGAGAGQLNTAGQRNSFFGTNAGGLTDANANSFFGDSAGSGNTSGFSNTFFGVNAGITNTTGSNNTIIGTAANVSINNLTNATAIGANAIVSTSNTVVLGRSLDTVQVPGNLNVGGNFTGSFTVPTSNGGTGLGSSGATGNVLRSNGSVWTSSALQAADIPNLSASYIQNTISPQAASNFNVSGNGVVGGTLSANVVNAATQYDIGNSRILGTAGNFNLFAGNSAGPATTGSFNAFFGGGAGFSNSTGSGNVIIGALAGDSNTTGSNNTIIGVEADVTANNLTNATAIGVRAAVGASNSLVLGSINGVNSATVDTNVGIGTTAPTQRLHVVGNGLFTGNLGIGTNPSGFKLDVAGRARFQQNAGDTGTTNTAGFWLFQNTPNADRAFIGMENDTSVGFFGNNGGDWGLAMNTQTGITSIRNLANVGSTSLCRNGQNEVSFCSSSLKYKTNIIEFTQGFSFVSKLRPISFDWKDGGMRDVGFGAEDIAKIDPRFVTYNAKGEVEGVKYDRLSVAFVNAFKEQQAEISGQSSVISGQQKQIEDLDSKIKFQQAQIDALKKLVCAQNPTAEICKEKQ